MNELSIFYFLPFIYILQVEVITVQMLAQQKKQRRRYEVCFQIRCSFYLVKLQYTNNFLLQIFSRFSVRYLRHLRLMIVKIFNLRYLSFVERIRDKNEGKQITQLQSRIQNSVKHLRISFLQKLLKAFSHQLFSQKDPFAVFDRVLNTLFYFSVLQTLVLICFKN